MKKIQKKLLIIFLLLFLYITEIYICAINAIPESKILFTDENLNIKTIFGISLENEYNKSIETSTSTNQDTNLNINYNVKLFNTFTVKKIGINIIERTKVIPTGNIAGLKIYTSGVLIVGMSEIKGLDNKTYKPYENLDIQEGDIIYEIENHLVTNTDNLVDIINQSKGQKLKIKYMRNNEKYESEITPIQTKDLQYKLGLWVRDSAAGIGTMTFYNPSTNCFAALGHGITDIDTGDLLNISNGEFITTKILSIIKGKKGAPGKIQGSIEDETKIGTIIKNTNLGIYGIIENPTINNINLNNEMEVASKNEICLGDAKILCSLDNDSPKEYTIKIEKIYLNNDYDNKSMLLEITDNELLEKTGGIIQGMSGCPIIQNGKFIGAITNVLVNDPTKGYAIFGDLMIKEMNSIK